MPLEIQRAEGGRLRLSNNRQNQTVASESEARRILHTWGHTPLVIEQAFHSMRVREGSAEDRRGWSNRPAAALAPARLSEEPVAETQPATGGAKRARSPKRTPPPPEENRSAAPAAEMSANPPAGELKKGRPQASPGLASPPAPAAPAAQKQRKKQRETPVQTPQPSPTPVEDTGADALKNRGKTRKSRKRAVAPPPPAVVRAGKGRGGAALPPPSPAAGGEASESTPAPPRQVVSRRKGAPKASTLAIPEAPRPLPEPVPPTPSVPPRGERAKPRPPSRLEEAADHFAQGAALLRLLEQERLPFERGPWRDLRLQAERIAAALAGKPLPTES